jgi:exodeoxyribonuclease-1
MISSTIRELRMNSLLAFDYATTGSDPAQDRPMEFACVRLDMDLNIIGNPTSLHCRPSPDHLPDPAACILNGITPQFCEQVGLAELPFVNEVHRQLSTSGTIGFGYNSIAFDDELTRFMFWRNLIDPYAHEWKNGCGRWDLIELVRATYALRPETLEWPRDDSGSVSFRLDQLSVTNGLLQESTHDALSNVYATVELARVIKDRQPQLYAHMFSMRDKTQALQEMNASSHAPFIHIGAETSTAAGVRLMLPITQHPTNRNEVIAWDLSKDPRQLHDLDAESIRLRLFTRHDQRPEDFEAMPLHSIAANKSPAVFRNLHVLSRERAVELDIDVAAASANVTTLLGVLDTLDLPRLLQVVYARDPLESDVEQALYDGFIGNHDRRALDLLRELEPNDLASLEPEFSDPRLGELFLRYKARHYPNTLSQRERDKWEEHRYRKLVTGHAGSRTVATVRESVEAQRRILIESAALADTARYHILDDVLAHTNRLAAEIDPYETMTSTTPPLPPVEPALAPEASSMPVQTDLFGDQIEPPVSRRVRTRHR